MGNQIEEGRGSAGEIADRVMTDLNQTVKNQGNIIAQMAKDSQKVIEKKEVRTVEGATPLRC